MLTNRTDVQKDIDAKFKKYKQITEQIMEEKNKMTEDYKTLSKQIDQQILENEKEAQAHIRRLKKSLKEEKERGCAEYANLLVSLHNH